jgi:hypothetical protein
MSLLDDPDFAHTDVQVQTRTGAGPRGDQYAAPVTRSVIVEDGRKQVRDSNGALTVSETTLFDHLDQVGLYAVGSRVTVHDRTALVIAAKRRELGDPDIDHLEIAVT